MIYPFALQLNSSASMIVVVILGLVHQSVLAADIAVVHSATLALLLSFAANARSIILNSESRHSFETFVSTRLLLWLPLAGGALALSTLFSDVVFVLAITVVIRRSSEWFAELVISEAERIRHKSVGVWFIITELIGLIAVIGSLVFGLSWAALALGIWAVLPFAASWPMLRPVLFARKGRLQALHLLPHFGSSLVLGTSTYVFRVLIVLLVGKEIAGSLFAAFAIGSMAGTTFSTGIGPTLALRSKEGRVSGLQIVRLTSISLVCVGSIVIWGALMWGEVGSITQTFWYATGLSLLGGALMVYAQFYRLKQLQGAASRSVFSEDVLANILAVAVLPSLYFVSNGKLVVAAYLINAVIALFIYWHASRRQEGMLTRSLRSTELLGVMYALLLLPVFIQPGSGIFRDPAFLFDSGGSIMRLPIPLSIMACGLGYLVLRGFEYAQFSLSLIFFTFLALIIAGIAGTAHQLADQSRKLTLATQFLLPMFAMPLGQIVGREGLSLARLARSFLYVLMVVAPAQILATWLSGSMVLQPYVGLFSVYQHLQYVPVIFAAAYVLALFSLYGRPEEGRVERVLLMAGGPLIGIYILLAGSLLGFVGFLLGLLGFVATRWRRQVYRPASIMVLVAVVIMLVGYLSGLGSQRLFKLDAGGGRGVSAWAEERLVIWEYYISSSTQNFSTLSIGNPVTPDRSRFPSAHNYYLDLLYNFGLLGLTPVVVAIIGTGKIVVRNWTAISRSLEWQALFAVVMFLLIVDNSLKVGLRQPYPGIFSFFLWGVLVSWSRMYIPRDEQALDVGGRGLEFKP